MNYSTDSYAAMLLCLALSPNREEYAHPLTTSEYRDVCRRTKASSARHIGDLIGVDISGIMQLLGVTEEEAYRIYTLMSRSVQLSYTMEGFAMRGIKIITEFDEGYPLRLKKRAGEDAPPVMYVYGDAETLNAPSIGILGMSGIKTSAEVRASIEAITAFANKAGYRVMAGGELKPGTDEKDEIIRQKDAQIKTLQRELLETMDLLQAEREGDDAVLLREQITVMQEKIEMEERLNQRLKDKIVEMVLDF